MGKIGQRVQEAVGTHFLSSGEGREKGGGTGKEYEVG